MAGNLTIFAGPGDGDAQIDRYSEFLRTVGGPLLPHSWLLWVVRVLLIASLVVHVVGVVQLRKRNAAARPSGHHPRRVGRSWSARSMMITGPLLLAFIVFHILQFTTLTIQVDGDMRKGAVYSNVHQAFEVWWVVLLYVAAVLAVGFHLRHGIWSVTQTLGIDSPRRNGRLRAGANVLTIVVVGGFVSVPVLVWTGVLPAP
jgi:succinate dehydrogenase / fumarate reductase, cytochrome b subunit